MQFHVTSQTDVGHARHGKQNEDCLWYQVCQKPGQEPLAFLAISDGMGGHMGGALASYWTIESIKQSFNDMLCAPPRRNTIPLNHSEAPKDTETKSFAGASQDFTSRLQEATRKANQVIREFSIHKPDIAANAGSTLTMGVLQGNQAWIANVGDSRTYLIRGQSIQAITQDHSLVAALAATGQIQPSEIYQHPQRNVIYRSIGQKEIIHADIYQLTIQQNDIFLLCSDGLWEMVHDPQILEILLTQPDLDTAARQLITAANAAGGEDNISLILCKAEE